MRCLQFTCLCWFSWWGGTLLSYSANLQFVGCGREQNYSMCVWKDFFRRFPFFLLTSHGVLFKCFTSFAYGSALLVSDVGKMNAGAICTWWILALLDMGKGMSSFSNWHHFSVPLTSKATGPIFHGSKLRSMAFWSESSAPHQKVQAWWWLLQPSHGWVTLLWGAGNGSEVRNDLPYPMDMHWCSAYE